MLPVLENRLEEDCLSRGGDLEDMLPVLEKIVCLVWVEHRSLAEGHNGRELGAVITVDRAG